MEVYHIRKGGSHVDCMDAAAMKLQESVYELVMNA